MLTNNPTKVNLMLSRSFRRQLSRKSLAVKQLRTFSKSVRVSQNQDTRTVPEYYEGSLEPNAPSHKCYILLHTPEPPTVFPPVHKTPLSQELQLRAKQWGGIVNFSWLSDTHSSSTLDQAATVFSASSGRLEIPHLSLENVDEVEKTILDHLRGPCSAATAEGVHIYVCTHGQRDCRCGDRGFKVYEALVQAVADAKAQDVAGLASRIRIGQVGHVGGHKFAANLLYFPQGEWLGLIKPEDAPAIIQRACQDLLNGARPLIGSDPPSFPGHWRGRMGLTKEEQIQLHAAHQV